MPSSGQNGLRRLVRRDRVRSPTRTSTVSVSRGSRRAGDGGGRARGPAPGGRPRAHGSRSSRGRRSSAGRSAAAAHRAGHRHVGRARGPRRTQRSSSPPRLMSPRPTKSAGKRSRSPSDLERAGPRTCRWRRCPAARPRPPGAARAARRCGVAPERRDDSGASPASMSTCAKRAQPRQVHQLVGAAQPLAGRDDEHAGEAGGRRREGLRVGELAAEVEAAEEREDLAERRARRPAHATGQVEPASFRKRSAAARRRSGRGRAGRPGPARSSADRLSLPAGPASARRGDRADEGVDVPRVEHLAAAHHSPHWSKARAGAQQLARRGTGDAELSVEQNTPRRIPTCSEDS